MQPRVYNQKKNIYIYIYMYIYIYKVFGKTLCFSMHMDVYGLIQVNN